MMNITRKSVLTGKVRTRNIPVVKEDLALYETGSVSISDAMPYLNSQDREFIMVGITTNQINWEIFWIEFTRKNQLIK